VQAEGREPPAETGRDGRTDIRPPGISMRMVANLCGVSMNFYILNRFEAVRLEMQAWLGHISAGCRGDCDMATTAWAAADGIFNENERRQPAKAALSRKGLAIIAADGEPIALWKATDLLRTVGPDGFRIGARRQTGVFVLEPGTGGDLIRALAAIPGADAPMMPRTLIRTMVMIVAVVLTALFVLAWGFFWLAEWLVASGTGPGHAG
jgi:hypothetical protein